MPRYDDGIGTERQALVLERERLAQQALDSVAIDSAANKGAGGIVFLPSGRYRISRTILIPIAVRVYGVGKTRPVFVLAPNTPGFQKGVANMVIFTGSDTYNIGRVAQPVRS